MISCKDLARVVSSETKVGFFQRIEIKMHLFMCVHCAKYVSQLKKIGLETKKVFQKEAPKLDAHIEEIKKEVIQKLKQRSE